MLDGHHGTTAVNLYIFVVFEGNSCFYTELIAYDFTATKTSCYYALPVYIVCVPLSAIMLFWPLVLRSPASAQT